MKERVTNIAKNPSRTISVVLTVAVLTLFGSSGCRSVGGAMGSKDAESRSGTVWNVPAPNIPPPSLANRTVYVSVRNMSDAQDIDLRSAVRASVQESGYKLVDDPDTANFRLRTTIRYFGENEAADQGKTTANALGVIGGAATGVATGVGVGYLASSAGANRGISTGVGTGAGVVAGSLVGIGIANRMKAREWNLILDIILEERLAQAVAFTVASEQGVHSDAHTGVVTGRAGVDGQRTGGGATDRTTTSAQMERESNYFPHGIRLTAWARQIGMVESEALPLLEGRIRNVLPRVLPD